MFIFHCCFQAQYNATQPQTFSSLSWISCSTNLHYLISGGSLSDDDSLLECPRGYTLKEGDIPGWGQLGSNPTIESTILGCSNRCNDESSCCSFEYSPTTKKCNLNRECQPTVSVYQDYAFCTKSGNFSNCTISQS